VGSVILGLRQSLFPSTPEFPPSYSRVLTSCSSLGRSCQIYNTSTTPTYRTPIKTYMSTVTTYHRRLSPQSPFLFRKKNRRKSLAFTANQRSCRRENMIVTGERGTSEVHDAFEMSDQHVRYSYAWDSRSVVETSQLELCIPISIRLVCLSGIRTTYYTGSCASSFFKLFSAQYSNSC
jgi:hypothetical protein